MEDSGWSITGGLAHVGSVGLADATRSATNWRARIKSVPGLKIIVIDESCGTDFDRITYRNGRVVDVESTTDVATSAAEKRCGLAKTDRAAQVLMKLLAQRREQRAAAQFAAVKKRFGL